MDLVAFVALVGAAVAIGWVASMIGVGGGIFIVPLLAVTGLAPTTQVAVGTSLAAIVFNSLSSSLAYWRQGKIDARLGVVLMPTAAAGAWTGALLTAFVSSGALAVAFGLFLIYVSALMLAGRAPQEAGLWLRRRLGVPDDGRLPPLATAAVGLFAGLASGVFGIGGGAVMVPAMTILMGAGMVGAVATSLFVMGPSSFVGAVGHWRQGNLDLSLALPLALGIVLGAQLGAFSTRRVPESALRRLFGVVLLYTALGMIRKGLALP